jgi:membrane-bound metal-dependent hydrolase YbcI (DUF457 family)
MPGYKIHSLAGIVIVGVLIFALEPALTETIRYIVVGILYSLLPDIDIESSKISKAILMMGLAGLLTLIYFSYILPALALGLVLVLMRFLKHRGFIHSIRAAIIFALPLIFLGYIEVIFGFLLYVFHLGLDGSFKW